MPTYDYKCNACGHAFEQFQSMKDKVLRACPNCGKKALERLIGTGAAIVFKGSGFYQTDYRSEGYKKAKEAETKPAGEGKADTKGTETKSPSSSSEPTKKPESTKSSSEAKKKSKGKEE